MEQFFNINLSQLSFFNYVGLAIFGGIIFGILWLFKNYLVLLVFQSPVRRKKVITHLPAIYTLIWVLFSIYALYIIIQPFPFLGILLCLVLIYLGRGYLANLIHGLFFRLKGDIHLGQKIALDNHEGFVHKLNTFDIEIQNKEGEIIQIPYKNMASKEVVKKDFSSDFTSFKFSMTIPQSTAESEIRNKLLQMPFVTNVFEPKISKTNLEGSMAKFDIVVYVLDEKYHSTIENKLKMSLL